MNNHLTKDVPEETLLQPDDPRITKESDVKPYIFKFLDNSKLSRSQYIATSIINGGLYIDNVFALKYFSHTLHRQHSKVICNSIKTSCST